MLRPASGERQFLLLALAAALVLLCGCHRHTFEDNYRDGLKNLDNGKYEMAQSFFERATMQNPESIEAQYQLAVAHLKQHDDVTAYSLLRTAEERDKQSTVSLKIRLELAKLFLAGHEYEQAQRRLVWILQRDPNDKSARGLLATSFAGMAHPEEASQEIDRLLSADPGNLQARVLSAAIDLSKRDGAAAEKVLLEGVQTSNRSIDSLLAMASFYQIVGQIAKSAELYQEIVKRDPKSVLAHTRLGWLYARAGDKASAERAFREVATLAPNDSKAVLALANYYVNIGDWPEAVTEVERLAKKNKDAGTRNMLAEVYYFAGRRGDALKLTQQLIDENNQDTRARMLRGMLLLNTQQFDSAIGEFTHVLYYQSDLAPAHYFLAVASMATGAEQIALQHMERALQINKGMVSARLWLIDYHFKRGDKTAALNLAREAPEKQQSMPEFVVIRAVCSGEPNLTLDQQSQLQNALLAKPGLIMDYADVGLAPFLKLYGGPVRDQLEAAVKSNPNFRPAQAVLTKILEAQGKQEQALAEMTKKVAANPKSFADLILLAKLQVKAGHLPAARDTLQKANLLKAGSPDVMLGMEQIDEQTGNLDEALTYLQELTQKFPKVAEGWGRLGALQERRHAITEARAAYEKALQLDPRDAIATNNLAWLLANSQGEMDRALTLAKKAHQLDPSNAGLSDTLGWIQYRMGNYPDALEALGEAAKRDPENAYFHYHLGMAQSRSGRDKEALSNLQGALRINPRLPEAQEIRGEMATLLRSTSR
jgi:tetratricopeptide (TPR) repeat protein